MKDKKSNPAIEQRGFSMPKPVAPTPNNPQPGAGKTMPKPQNPPKPAKNSK